VIQSLRRALGDQADLVLVASMVGILIVLFTPISARALDVLLLINLAFAFLLLLLTFYVSKPVEFSTYPSLLLIGTLFRLSLNIAATRLILSDANGGKVIGAIGEYVVQGNFVIGLIVFLILVVVQYVVVTSGAQRVAEVAARFTLDSMPGQQMSIDADLNMGFIDQNEAQRRRRNIEKEANFYGAMDGASKFVKGDAIAGIIILLIDIVGGLAVGVLQLGMSWSEAARTFTLLTVGDGIVTQVPALVIAVGTGIIVTRSGTDNQLSHEIASQIAAFPKALLLVAAALVGIGFLPGMPLTPVVCIAVIAAGVAIYLFRRHRSDDVAEDSSVTAASGAEEQGITELLQIDPVEVRVGHELADLVSSDNDGLGDRIVAFRKQFALDAGTILPRVRFRSDGRLSGSGYQISIFGVKAGEGELLRDRTLAIHPAGVRGRVVGIETKDPTYGLPASWIEEAEKVAARAAGFTLVDPTTVFVTHLTEVLRRSAAELLTRAETQQLLERVRERNASLVDELVPQVLSLAEVQRVLQTLLREKVSIRHLDGILEVLSDAGRHTRQADQLTELVRQRMGAMICQSLTSARGELTVLTLDPAVEQAIAKSIQSSTDDSRMLLEPRFAEQIIGRLAGLVEQMMKSNLTPVLLCAPELRRHLRSFTERVLPHLAVLSMTEVPAAVNLRSFGTVTL
jgi:flagellar biosynthesis protein FlhA